MRFLIGNLGSALQLIHHRLACMYFPKNESIPLCSCLIPADTKELWLVYTAAVDGIGLDAIQYVEAVAFDVFFLQRKFLQCGSNNLI
jgi:hypothetical protein